jgi:hypothetical protein
MAATTHTTAPVDDGPVFEADEPGTAPKPFTLRAIDKTKPANAKDRKVDGVFWARPDMSFGALLVDMTEDDSMASTMAFYEKALVVENSHPDGDDDDRTEFERFRDFIGDPDLYVPDKLLRQMAEWLTEQNSERPTVRPDASRSTRRRNAQHGSTARRR